MANRETSQFATLAAGSQSSTMYLPIVDTSLGHVAGANLKVTLNSLFFDLGLNTADGATGMTGLLAAPSAAVAGKLKWYYNNSTKQWLASIDAGSYYSVQRSIAAGLTAGWLPYVDTGGILNGSANATLDSNGQIGCKFVNLTSNAAGLNSVAEINDSTGTDRWEIRLGASNQLIFNDVVNNKDVITCTPGATPVVQLNGTLRWLTDNSQDIGLINSGRARTAYIGTSVIIGRSSNTTGVLTFNNSTNTNQTSFQAGAAAASRTYTWPTDFGAAGSVLTDAAGNGTLSWAVPAGTIGGSIAATQVAYGSGANTITGSGNFTYVDPRLLLINPTPSSTTPPLEMRVNTPSGLWGDSQALKLLNTDGTANNYVGINFSSNSGAIAAGIASVNVVPASNYADLAFSVRAASGFISNAFRIFGGSNNGTVSINSSASIAQLGIFVNASTTVGQIIKLAAGQTADAFSIQNSAGVFQSSFNPSGFLIFGSTSYSGADRAIWLRTPQYDTSTTLYGIVNDSTFPSTATAAVYRYYSLIGTTAAAYTLTAAYNYFAGQPNLGAGSAITSSYGIYISKQKSTGVTTGYGVYQADSADLNYFAGAGSFGNTTFQDNSGNIALSVKMSASYKGGIYVTDNFNFDSYSAYLSTSVTTAGTNKPAFAAQLQASFNGTFSVRNGTNGGFTGYFQNAPVDAGQGGGAILAQPTVINRTVANLEGVGALIYLQGATANVTTSYGFRTDVLFATATCNLTTHYDLFISPVTSPANGTIATRYAVYINSDTSGVTTNYGIYQTNASTINYLAGILRLQLTSSVGVLSIGGASQSGAYIGVSTSSQVANDKLISVSMAGSITGTLYAADISMTATVNVLTRITNTENATATSNCELQLVTGGASGGDPFIHFNISEETDWSIGADNSDSDKLVIAASTALGTSNALTITTAGLVTFAGSITITGKQKNLTVSTGAGSALLGANSPAATLTAPFEWINVTLSDGSNGYVPAWK